MELTFGQLVINGLLLAFGLGALIVASMLYNPRLWVQDYPKEAQAVVPPLNADEKRAQHLLSLMIMVMLLGGLGAALVVLRGASGGDIAFVPALITVFVMLQTFNLFDAVVLDFLLLAVLRPKALFIPEAMPIMNARLMDWRLHVLPFLKGFVFCTAFSIPIALIAALF